MEGSLFLLNLLMVKVYNIYCTSRNITLIQQLRDALYYLMSILCFAAAFARLPVPKYSSSLTESFEDFL